jgi:hypothetical protein
MMVFDGGSASWSLYQLAWRRARWLVRLTKTPAIAESLP